MKIKVKTQSNGDILYLHEDGIPAASVKKDKSGLYIADCGIMGSQKSPIVDECFRFVHENIHKASCFLGVEVEFIKEWRKEV